VRSGRAQFARPASVPRRRGRPRFRGIRIPGLGRK